MFFCFAIGFFLMLYDYRCALEWAFFITLIILFATVSFICSTDPFNSYYGVSSSIFVKGLFAEVGTLGAAPFFYYFGVDALSVWFLFLLSIVFLCCYYYFADQLTADYHSPDLFIFVIFILQFVVYVCFITFDLLIFFFFFESLLLPLYFIILLWGAGLLKKYRAGLYFVIYTLLFSSPLLYGIFYIVNKAGTSNLYLINTLLFSDSSNAGNVLACGCMLLAFCAKAPIFPLHVWLPEAHVEAPTTGSVILASLVLKLGAYGLLRFTFPLFKQVCLLYTPFLLAFSAFGCVYAAFLAIRQLDLKKVIAYSSVVHMNFSLVGFFSWTAPGFLGGFVTLIAHGLVSSCLFFLIGMLYRRVKTRQVSAISGLVVSMPLGVFFLFIAFLANTGFPLSVNFIGEFFMLVGLCGSSNSSFTLLLICCFGFFLNLVYNMWTFSRLAFGELNLALRYKLAFDLTLREFNVLLTLFLPVLFLGIYPDLLIKCFLAYLQFFYS